MIRKFNILQGMIGTRRHLLSSFLCKMHSNAGHLYSARWDNKTGTIGSLQTTESVCLAFNSQASDILLAKEGTTIVFLPMHRSVRQ